MSQMKGQSEAGRRKCRGGRSGGLQVWATDIRLAWDTNVKCNVANRTDRLTTDHWLMVLTAVEDVVTWVIDQQSNNTNAY